MIEGVSGILAMHPRDERPIWEPSRRRLEWRNGAIAQAFSAEDPESLRGPQFECAWLDEFAKWRHAQETFDMLQFGLRLGERPRQLVTTTPRPSPALKKLMANPRVAIARASTYANAQNLAPSFIETIVGRYAGTRLGRQELDGEIVEDSEGALWSRDILEACREDAAPALSRVIVAIDPPASSRAAPIAAASSRLAWTPTGSSMCWRTPRWARQGPPSGRARPSPVISATRRTASSRK